MAAAATAAAAAASTGAAKTAVKRQPLTVAGQVTPDPWVQRAEATVLARALRAAPLDDGAWAALASRSVPEAARYGAERARFSELRGTLTEAAAAAAAAGGTDGDDLVLEEGGSAAAAAAAATTASSDQEDHSSGSDIDDADDDDWDGLTKVRRGGQFMDDAGTRKLLQSIGGPPALRDMCATFYSKMFLDPYLSQFVFLDDGAQAHGQRLGDWLAEKMGGPAEWTAQGRSRSASHRKAWYSENREPGKEGRRFKLDDSRIWMRLMFWAAREAGLHRHQVFWDWYVDFIAHFIAVYEFTAPPYARADAEWSANPSNILTYLEQGRRMEDVIDVHERVSYY